MTEPPEKHPNYGTAIFQIQNTPTLFFRILTTTLT